MPAYGYKLCNTDKKARFFFSISSRGLNFHLPFRRNIYSLKHADLTVCSEEINRFFSWIRKTCKIFNFFVQSAMQSATVLRIVRNLLSDMFFFSTSYGYFYFGIPDLLMVWPKHVLLLTSSSSSSVRKSIIVLFSAEKHTNESGE